MLWQFVLCVIFNYSELAFHILTPVPAILHQIFSTWSIPHIAQSVRLKALRGMERGGHFKIWCSNTTECFPRLLPVSHLASWGGILENSSYAPGLSSELPAV